MVDTVKKRLRERPVEADLDEIKEVLNREHGPTITEIRTRLNEVINGLNPGDVVPAAGAVANYLEVTVGGVGYSIPLHNRS